jgi:hypothetical protein
LDYWSTATQAPGLGEAMSLLRQGDATHRRPYPRTTLMTTQNPKQADVTAPKEKASAHGFAHDSSAAVFHLRRHGSNKTRDGYAHLKRWEEWRRLKADSQIPPVKDYSDSRPE